MKLVQLLEEGEPIWALTTLNKELFVHYEGNTDITVYDTETYKVRRSLRVPRLGGVSDMTSCKRYQCIYISDWENEVVHRVDIENTITRWSVGDMPDGLSVNSVYNVLVTCYEKRKIKVFTSGGTVIRVIRLQSDVVNPFHSVELTTDKYIVCHGTGNDQLHRVCLVDSSGRVLKSYGGFPGSGSGQLNVPVRLAVYGELILVTDRTNHRVLGLNQSLSYVGEVVTCLRDLSKIDQTFSNRMCFDENTSRLYVADNKDLNDEYVSGHVTVYSM